MDFMACDAIDDTVVLCSNFLLLESRRKRIPSGITSKGEPAALLYFLEGR